jgi:LytR cell envelope-related transcriptional attenuator
VVIGNAGPADLLATRTAPVLRRLGYRDLVITTAIKPWAVTTVLFAPGWKREARTLAAQLAVGEGEVQPRPAGSITVGNERGDIWVLVGASRPPPILQATGE